MIALGFHRFEIILASRQRPCGRQVISILGSRLLSCWLFAIHFGCQLGHPEVRQNPSETGILPKSAFLHLYAVNTYCFVFHTDCSRPSGMRSIASIRSDLQPHPSFQKRVNSKFCWIRDVEGFQMPVWNLGWFDSRVQWQLVRHLLVGLGQLLLGCRWFNRGW